MSDAVIDAIDQVLIGDAETPPQPAIALARYRDEAERGSAQAALRLALMAAQGLARPPDWSEALDLLLAAALLGSPSAQRQLAVLADRPAAAGEADFREARAALMPDTLLTPPKVRGLCEAPRIGVIEGLISPAYCAWLIERAGAFLEPSLVYSASGDAKEDATRTAKVACFDFLERDMVVAVIQERLARVSGLRVPHHEPPNVLSYTPGEQFTDHFDFLDPATHAQEVEALGQRVVTGLTYLNDDYEGGETAFPTLGLRYRGKPGDCLIFFNVTPDREPDRRTLHAGLPVTRGRKWLLSQWLRTRPQPLM